MNSVAAHPPLASGQIHDLLQHRLERALRDRLRYRYVKPTVSIEGSRYRIQSPCCSRNVDPTGGVIDIALLEHDDHNRWCLSSRDHATGTWVLRAEGATLDAALDALCVDRDRQFWP